MRKTLKHVKKVVVGVIGVSVTLFGIALLVLPGPAFIVIPAGLAILATEFVWAKRLLDTVKTTFKDQMDKAQNNNGFIGRTIGKVKNMFSRSDKKS